MLPPAESVMFRPVMLGLTSAGGESGSATESALILANVSEAMFASAPSVSCCRWAAEAVKV